jgi:glycosyltransferase involved in cell wall biosynthesis
MLASVIMTTYNAPQWLQKVLWGFAAQVDLRFEVVVADDGSQPETLQLLRKMGPTLPYPVRHVWQPDDGFRKCQALNQGIQASRGAYLIFTDADCIPHRDFVAWHLRLARPRCFLSGGYNKLSMATSEALVHDDIAAGRHCDPSWLASHGSADVARGSKLRRTGDRWAVVCDRLTTTKPTWNGHNASTWKSYAITANGFDHRMHYGGQDREFGERLVNAGIRGVQIRHRAVCVHLDHKRGYATPESIAKNKAIRAETRKNGRTACEQGLAQLDHAEAVLTDLAM